MLQSTRLRWIFLDRYRLLRSFVVGVLISLQEAVAIGMFGSRVLGVCLVCRAAWRMDDR